MWKKCWKCGVKFYADKAEIFFAKDMLCTSCLLGKCIKEAGKIVKRNKLVEAGLRKRQGKQTFSIKKVQRKPKKRVLKKTFFEKSLTFIHLDSIILL